MELVDNLRNSIGLEIFLKIIFNLIFLNRQGYGTEMKIESERRKREEIMKAPK